MRARPSILLACLAALSCSASPHTTATDAGEPAETARADARDGRGDAASPMDAGRRDAGPSLATRCEEADATPALDCGTLEFTKSPVASRPRNHHVTLIAPVGSGNLLYAIGGVNADVPIDNVDLSPIASDGSLGPWVVARALPLALGGHVGSLVGGVIVIAGGNTGATISDLSYSSVIQPNGDLGPWNMQGVVGHARMHAGSFSIGKTMWVLGGFDNQSVWNDIVSATVAPDGTVSSWKPAGTLPGPRSHFSLTVVDDYVYITGGLDKSAYDDPPDLADAWVGQVLNDGSVGNWKQLTDLPVAEATHASFFYGGYLYVCGGINNVPAEDDRCWRAAVLADHSLGKFEEVASLLIARGHVHQLPTLNGLVYSIAGAIDFNLDSTTEVDIGSFGAGTRMKRSRTTPARDSVPVPAHKRHGMAKCHMLQDRQSPPSASSAPF